MDLMCVFTVGYATPRRTARVNSIKSLTAVPDDDGGGTIHLGANPAGRSRALPFMPGGNYTLRLYRARLSVLDGTWVASRPEAI